MHRFFESTTTTTAKTAKTPLLTHPCIPTLKPTSSLSLSGISHIRTQIENGNLQIIKTLKRETVKILWNHIFDSYIPDLEQNFCPKHAGWYLNLFNARVLTSDNEQHINNNNTIGTNEQRNYIQKDCTSMVIQNVLSNIGSLSWKKVNHGKEMIEGVCKYFTSSPFHRDIMWRIIQSNYRKAIFENISLSSIYFCLETFLRYIPAEEHKLYRLAPVRTNISQLQYVVDQLNKEEEHKSCDRERLLQNLRISEIQIILTHYDKNKETTTIVPWLLKLYKRCLYLLEDINNDIKMIEEEEKKEDKIQIQQVKRKSPSCVDEDEQNDKTNESERITKVDTHVKKRHKKFVEMFDY